MCPFLSSFSLMVHMIPGFGSIVLTERTESVSSNSRSHPSVDILLKRCRFSFFQYCKLRKACSGRHATPRMAKREKEREKACRHRQITRWARPTGSSESRKGRLKRFCSLRRTEDWVDMYGAGSSELSDSLAKQYGLPPSLCWGVFLLFLSFPRRTHVVTWGSV